MLSFLKSALSLYQLAFLSILMALVKCCGSLMQLSNISLESTFLYSLQLFSFSWLVWPTLLFSSPGSGSSTFQGGEFSGGQGIQRYKYSLKLTMHLTPPSITTGLDCSVPDPEEVANSLHIPGAAEAAQVKEKEAVSQLSPTQALSRIFKLLITKNSRLKFKLYTSKFMHYSIATC